MATQRNTTGNNGASEFVGMSKNRSSRPGSEGMENTTSKASEVFEFDHGVRVYPPTTPGGPWRIRWHERHVRRDTSAKNQRAAIAKATEIVDRLSIGSSADLVKAH